jgi:hypothetical protein
MPTKLVIVALYMSKLCHRIVFLRISRKGFPGEKSGVGLFGSEVTQLPFFAG